jgi:hypothetical protein
MWVCSGASALGAVEEATAEAEKHGGRSEALAALVAEARVTLEQARAAEAERARAEAEAVEVGALEAAERQRLEEQVATLTLVMQSAALQLQEAQSQLGVPPAPNPVAEDTMCVVCMDAPKDRIVLPCMHLCACGPCAQRLLELDASCPVCRGPIERMAQVFS